MLVDCSYDAMMSEDEHDPFAGSWIGALGWCGVECMWEPICATHIKHVRTYVLDVSTCVRTHTHRVYSRYNAKRRRDTFSHRESSGHLVRLKFVGVSKRLRRTAGASTEEHGGTPAADD